MSKEEEEEELQNAHDGETTEEGTGTTDATASEEGLDPLDTSLSADIDDDDDVDNVDDVDDDPKYDDVTCSTAAVTGNSNGVYTTTTKTTTTKTKKNRVLGLATQLTSSVSSAAKSVASKQVQHVTKAAEHLSHKAASLRCHPTSNNKGGSGRGAGSPEQDDQEEEEEESTGTTTVPGLALQSDPVTTSSTTTRSPSAATAATAANDPAAEWPEPLHAQLSSERAPVTHSIEAMILDDHTLLWIIVASIAVLETWKHRMGLMTTQSVPLSMVAAWMLVAFTIGLEVDGTLLIDHVKGWVLGGSLRSKAMDGTTSSSATSKGGLSLPPIMDNHLQVVTIPEDRSIHHDRFRLGFGTMRQILRRRKHGQATTTTTISSSPAISTTTISLTSLRRSKSQSDFLRRNMKVNARFAAKLGRFIKINRPIATAIHKVGDVVEQGAGTVQDGVETAAACVVEGGGSELDSSGSNIHRSHTMGREHTEATVLLSKLPIQPQCSLRGLDVFQTEGAEPIMGSHPFLLQNGLGDVPTLFLNMMTQWGCILVYFELPSFVTDYSKSLVEEENDAEEVKAIKRFLLGDQSYRRKRLKILPELVEAPYPVRLMAPKNKEIPIHQEGLVFTTYHQHEESYSQPQTQTQTQTQQSCPIFEVTLDLMCNSTIRGMTALVKRYLKKMSIDFAIVLSKPEGEIEDEPKAVLGVWRFDHMDPDTYPSLPDRFAYEAATTATAATAAGTRSSPSPSPSSRACSEESMDAARANQLVQEAAVTLSHPPPAMVTVASS